MQRIDLWAWGMDLDLLESPTEIAVVRDATGKVSGLTCTDTEGTQRFLPFERLYISERGVSRDYAGRTKSGCLGGCNYGGFNHLPLVDTVIACAPCKLKWIEENLDEP